jgi:serine/threonine protein kinase
MEYLEGETLADRIARGPLPVRDALQIGGEIADALDKAHRQGVVHRDLKPGNVMLTKVGSKLLDFGLAKLHPSSALGLSGTPTVTTPLTDAGTIVGTYQYMAPEQLEGRDADARTDIFAFGALVYEMVIGRRPFAGTSQASVIAAILRRPCGAFCDRAAVASGARRHHRDLSRKGA